MRVLCYTICGFFVILCLFVACGQTPVITDENKSTFDQPLAWGDGFTIPASHVFDRMQFAEIGKPGGILPDSEVRRFLDTLLLDTLTGLEANNVNLRDHYLAWWSYRLRYQDFAIKAFFDEMIRYKIFADSAEVTDFYETHKDQFSYSEQVELYHILISPQVLAIGPDSSIYGVLDSVALDQAARDYAFAIYDSIQAGEPFEDLAMRHSHDQISVLGGGYLGWTPRGRYIDPFDSVAFALQPSQTAAPYRDRDGWHIVMISDHVDEGPAPLSEQRVWDGARDMVIAEKVAVRSQQVVDSLMTGVGFEFNTDLLDSNSAQIDDTVWAAVVISPDSISWRDTLDFRFLKNYETEYIMRYGQASLNQTIKRSLLYQIGRRFVVMRALDSSGIAERDYIKAERHHLRHQAAKSVLQSSRFDVAWQPSEEEIKAYFDSHIDEFQTDKPLTVAVITANDSVLAVYLRDLANSGYELEDLVENYVPRDEGMEATLQPATAVGPSDLPEPLYTAAIGTRAGATSDVTRIDDSTFAICKVFDRRESRSFDQVRGSILSTLVQQYRRTSIEQVYQSLKDKYHAQTAETLPKIRLRPYVERTRTPIE